jgi:FkbH-like protein
MLKYDFYRILKKNISNGDELVVLHSSLLHFNLDWKCEKWNLLLALKQLIDEGFTLLVPCFTFSFCKGHSYHYLHSNSEVGILGDWFRHLDGVVRTQHPIYSFAIAGPKTHILLKCKNTTTFGEDSIFSLLEKKSARLIMFGNDWSYCTQLHHQEELMKVPYRFFKTFNGDMDTGNGMYKAKASMFVRDDKLSPVNNFNPVIQQLYKNNSIYDSAMAGACISSTTASELGNVCRQRLSEDVYSLVNQPNVIKYQMQNRGLLNSRPVLKIALVGQSNLSLVEQSLQKNLKSMIQDQRIEVFTLPFGQSYQLILDANSSLWGFDPDLIFFLDRMEDVYRRNLLKDIEDSDNEKLLQYINMIRIASSHCKGEVYVASLTYSEKSLFMANNCSGKVANLKVTNTQLLDSLSDLSNVSVIDINHWYIHFSGGEIRDDRLWFIGKFPYSKLFSDYLGKRLSGIVLAESGRTIRLMILDLDNTLWGGVLGEEGIEGLMLGGDYPGNAFKYFQEVIRQKMDEGIAIAIASKNNEEEALYAISTLASMQFNNSNIATWRINWKEKWKNILEISNEMGLGLENILFIDDNPVEREKVRQNLPEIKILELPDDPTQFAKVLLESPYLEQLHISGEDMGRSKQYVNKRLMEQERTHHVSPEEFFSSLQPKLYIDELSKININRASQLIKKTNQFNTTTIRFTKVELEKLANSGRSVYVLGLEDRFTEKENIGVAIIHWNSKIESAIVELFLLSCRVLERGVETGFLSWVCEQCKNKGIKILIGNVAITPRNMPAQNFYKVHDFYPDKKKEKWTLDNVSNTSVKKPTWLTIQDTIQDIIHQ